VSFWRQFARGLRVLGNRKVADQEIADEVSNYLAEATAAFVARDSLPMRPAGPHGWNWVARRRFANKCAGTGGRTE
jgi:hypothetical protein